MKPLVSDESWAVVEPLVPKERHRWAGALRAHERTLAWLSKMRRLTIPYGRRADIREAFLTLGCALICLNCLQRFRSALVESVPTRALCNAEQDQTRAELG